MSSAELELEWKYSYEERLAILGVVDKPTPEQFAIAAAEADAVVERINAESKEQDHYGKQAAEV